MASRSRLPEGFPHFRSDFGVIVKKRRGHYGWTQKYLATALGVSRETLSRIENGAWPRPDTLEGLMRHLDIDWGDFAVKGDTDRPAKRFDGSSRGEYRFEMGRALRRGRAKEGLSLEMLATRCHSSAALLSRLERGESSRSKLLQDHPDDLALPTALRRYLFVHAELRRIEALGLADVHGYGRNLAQQGAGGALS